MNKVKKFLQTIISPWSISMDDDSSESPRKFTSHEYLVMAVMCAIVINVGFIVHELL